MEAGEYAVSGRILGNSRATKVQRWRKRLKIQGIVEGEEDRERIRL